MTRGGVHFAGDFMTVEMEATSRGTWLLHDAVNKHADLGAETRYTVYAKKSGKNETFSGNIAIKE